METARAFLLTTVLRFKDRNGQLHTHQITENDIVYISRFVWQCQQDGFLANVNFSNYTFEIGITKNGDEFIGIRMLDATL